MITIAAINELGKQWIGFAGAMLWQSTLLMAVLALLDRSTRRRLPANIRYALWTLLLLKLVLPPSLSLPTGAIGIARDMMPIVRVGVQRPDSIYGERNLPERAAPGMALYQPRKEAIEAPALASMVWALGCVLLTVTVILRCRVATGVIGGSVSAPEFCGRILEDCRERLGLKQRVALRMTTTAVAPCVSGLLRPVILVPLSLVESLSSAELRGVILHELLHVKRGDLWVNFAQTCLQILYFYNPLLWWANARIRALREEAVDEATVVRLGSDGAIYPEALVHVARIAVASQRPAFGALGIFEAPSSLAKRVRRLLEPALSCSERIGTGGCFALLVIGLLLLPMGHAEDGRQPSGLELDLRHNCSRNSVRFSGSASIKTNTVPGEAVGQDPAARGKRHASRATSRF